MENFKHCTNCSLSYLKSMSRIKQKFFLNLKLLKLLVISPFLLSIPFFCNLNDLKAGMEFQWDQDSGYRRLKWFQTDNERRSRNSIFLFLRGIDRKQSLLKISIKIPKSFDSTLKRRFISSVLFLLFLFKSSIASIISSVFIIHYHLRLTKDFH